MEKNLGLNKPLKIQTVIIILLIFIFIILETYCIVFQWYNDNKKSSYDLVYLEKIYNEDEKLFNNCAERINENNILTISHNKSDINNIKNSVLNNTLYYEFAGTKKSLNGYYDVEKLFDKYDFDVIEREDDKIYLSYFSPSIQLVYSKHKVKNSRRISDFWYVEYIL